VAFDYEESDVTAGIVQLSGDTFLVGPVQEPRNVDQRDI
jgi:hypothetical protein